MPETPQRPPTLVRGFLLFALISLGVYALLALLRWSTT